MRFQERPFLTSRTKSNSAIGGTRPQRHRSTDVTTIIIIDQQARGWGLSPIAWSSPLVCCGTCASVLRATTTSWPATDSANRSPQHSSERSGLARVCSLRHLPLALCPRQALEHKARSWGASIYTWLTCHSAQYRQALGGASVDPRR